MENNELHTEKVKILSRLVKENYITLEEALLLLKEEEQEKQGLVNIGTGGYGTTAPYPSYAGWTTTCGNTVTYSVPPAFISTSASTIINTADESADLNN